MKYTVEQTEISENWRCILVDLTEEECDVSRNTEVGFEALKAGAIGYGTTYKPSDNTFTAKVTARDKETAQKAAEAYYEAIIDAVDSKA